MGPKAQQWKKGETGPSKQGAKDPIKGCKCRGIWMRLA